MQQVWSWVSRLMAEIDARLISWQQGIAVGAFAFVVCVALYWRSVPMLIAIVQRALVFCHRAPDICPAGMPAPMSLAAFYTAFAVSAVAMLFARISVGPTLLLIALPLLAMNSGFQP